MTSLWSVRFLLRLVYAVARSGMLLSSSPSSPLVVPNFMLRVNVTTFWRAAPSEFALLPTILLSEGGWKLWCLAVWESVYSKTCWWTTSIGFYALAAYWAHRQLYFAHHIRRYILTFETLLFSVLSGWRIRLDSSWIGAWLLLYSLQGAKHIVLDACSVQECHRNILWSYHFEWPFVPHHLRAVSTLTPIYGFTRYPSMGLSGVVLNVGFVLWLQWGISPRATPKGRVWQKKM